MHFRKIIYGLNISKIKYLYILEIFYVYPGPFRISVHAIPTFLKISG